MIERASTLSPCARQCAHGTSVLILVKKCGEWKHVGTGVVAVVGGKPAILTAAHVVANCLMSDDVTHPMKVQLKAVNDIFNVINCNIDQGQGFYLPQMYASHGTTDVGLAFFDVETQSKHPTIGAALLSIWQQSHRTSPSTHTRTTTLTLVQDETDSFIHGVSKDLYVQETVQSEEQPVQARVRVSGKSIPGCSGTFLLDGSGQGVGVLHGDGKHGRGGFHTRSDVAEHCNHFYFDRICNVTMLKVKQEKVHALRRAEDVLYDENTLLDDSGAYNDELKNSLQTLYDTFKDEVDLGTEELTIQKVMDNLAQVAFDKSTAVHIGNTIEVWAFY